MKTCYHKKQNKNEFSIYYQVDMLFILIVKAHEN